jgi:Uncharacterized protein conserved in bacteria (DUF2272)
MWQGGKPARQKARNPGLLPKFMPISRVEGGWPCYAFGIGRVFSPDALSTPGDFIMPSALVSPLVAAAMSEWHHWGESRWNVINGTVSHDHAIDDDDPFARYVIDTYLPPFYGQNPKWPTVEAIGQDAYPWSAVAISQFMARAGFRRKRLVSSKASAAEYAAWVASSQPDEFPLSEAHSDYIRWSIRARKDRVQGAAYWGFRVDEAEAVPEVGDLVGYVRAVKGMTHTKALAWYDKTGGYTSHTDLVVAVRPGEVDVIGGNVRDSVTLKTLRTNAAGQMADQRHFWFVVMKLR